MLSDEIWALPSAAVPLGGDSCFPLEMPFSFNSKKFPAGGWDAPVPLGRLFSSEHPQGVIREVPRCALLPPEGFLQFPWEAKVDSHVVGAAESLGPTKLATEMGA